ncbi:phosphopyruvate hydratase [Weissella paramesenteroides]|uniref:phosphopyruvate hydratase n=1 Tax=Weissella paramesenteroides TaxID=1249 RepID=UPI0013DA558A|nr:phosphopyruvate hydratase [Weissella paramesenteroides]NEZ89053.1 phosphopyruvate hydratase [Weissella paramesenteroides]NFB03378.1 phosphopyruvate hydratase [Weissella paramesenteroides]
MSVVIEKVTAREIFDSRGNPTVEADVILSDSTLGRSAVPSGASTGKKEAVELRDGGKRLNGKGVKKAVCNIETKINQALHGVDPQDQERVDRIMIELDGTSDKRTLGANAILAVSMANCRAAANSKSVPLYRYLGGVESELPQTFHNVINGGEHADNKIDIQEFMITPIKRTSFLDGFEKIVNTYHGLKQMLEERGYSTALGDEGGFAPNLKSSEEALQLLHDAIIASGYQPGTEIGIAFDAAASYFYDQETKSYEFEGNAYTPYELSNYYKELLDKFPEIISIEDPFSEDDWDSFIKFTQKFKDKIQIVADDPVCTNPVLIQKAIQCGLANTILIKLNQIGTVTETLNAIRLAKKNNYKVMISHRSGETGDTFISDFTVATKAGELKSGAPARSERVEKYNQLIRIEEEIN